ncbi:hypothetical protein VZT92_001956 [Zoarces viviparus]|uniref:Secreted protein n=1 Tax=Zoarces viviparus TaxID=48416 RepID=A0AAW1G5Y3_ZOAVI
MVGVFFSAVVAAACSSQYDGALSRQRAGDADGVEREGSGLTAARSNGGEGKDGHFRRSTRIGNTPELAPHDGRLVSPMNERGGWGSPLAATWKRGEVNRCSWCYSQAGPPTHWLMSSR